MSDTPETDLTTAYMAGNYSMSSMCREMKAENDVWRHEVETLRAALKEADDALTENITTFIDLRTERDKYKNALQQIANTDYRGNRSTESQIAWKALQ